MAHRDDSSSWGFFAGLATGVALSWMYVRYGYEPNNVVTLPAKVTSAAISITAESDLYNWDVTPEVRQRAAAVVLGQNPGTFIELDNATGNVLTKEMLRQKAERLAKLAKAKFDAYDMALDKPALRKALQRKHGAGDNETIKRRMLIDDIEGETFLHGYLTRRFPHATSQDLADIVLGVYQNELRGTEPALTIRPDDERMPR